MAGRSHEAHAPAPNPCPIGGTGRGHGLVWEDAKPGAVRPPRENATGEGIVKKPLKVCAFGALAFMAAGLVVTGCNFTPDLNKTAALALVQSEYDRRPAQGLIINVDSMGLKQGLDAKYWKLTKVYPNNRWADYTLTDDGKKLFTLNSGGDVIQWRPDQDSTFHFYITTVAATHPKARDMNDPQNDVIANVDTAKSAIFIETVNFAGIPDPLQEIAHRPGNTLATRRHAEFALEGGQWKLHEIN